jgi:uncharacterized protein YjbJ (UPF0337 family)
VSSPWNRNAWSLWRSRIKYRWEKLSDDDLTEIDGERQRILGRVGERYGLSVEEAERELVEWERRHLLR